MYCLIVTLLLIVDYLLNSVANWKGIITKRLGRKNDKKDILFISLIINGLEYN